MFTKNKVIVNESSEFISAESVCRAVLAKPASSVAVRSRL